MIKNIDIAHQCASKRSEDLKLLCSCPVSCCLAQCIHSVSFSKQIQPNTVRTSLADTSLSVPYVHRPTGNLCFQCRPVYITIANWHGQLNSYSKCLSSGGQLAVTWQPSNSDYCVLKYLPLRTDVHWHLTFASGFNDWCGGAGQQKINISTSQ